MYEVAFNGLTCSLITFFKGLITLSSFVHGLKQQNQQIIRQIVQKNIQI